MSDGIKAGQRFGEADRETAERFLKVRKDWFVLPRLSDGFQQSNRSRWDALIIRGVLLRKDHSCPGAHSDLDATTANFFATHGISGDMCAEEFCVGIEDALGVTEV